MYKVLYPPGGGGGYQVFWRRISSCDEGKEISRLSGRIYRGKKGPGKGKQYHLSYNIEAVGKNIKWWKKIRVGQGYQVVGSFIHSSIIHCDI